MTTAANWTPYSREDLESMVAKLHILKDWAERRLAHLLETAPGDQEIEKCRLLIPNLEGRIKEAEAEWDSRKGW